VLSASPTSPTSIRLCAELEVDLDKTSRQQFAREVRREQFKESNASLTGPSFARAKRAPASATPLNSPLMMLQTSKPMQRPSVDRAVKFAWASPVAVNRR
jgi:hypothetical protein